MKTTLIQGQVREAIGSIITDPGMTTEEKLIGVGLTLRYIPSPVSDLGRPTPRPRRPIPSRVQESRRINRGAVKMLAAFLTREEAYRVYS